MRPTGRIDELLTKQQRAGLTPAERAELRALQSAPEKPRALYNTGRPELELPTMTPTQALDFGDTPMPYGKFQGDPIRSVPREYLDWLVGTAPRGKDAFKDRLTAYLRATDGGED